MKLNMKYSIKDIADIPVGLIVTNDDKYPKILEINEKMMEILGGTEDDENFSFYKDNILFMIPFSDRERFFRHLDRARRNNTSVVSLRHRILKLNGQVQAMNVVIYWKENRFYISYYEIDEDDFAENAYFQALESAYNLIFQANLIEDQVRCIYGKSFLGKMSDTVLTVDSALEYWINNYIYEADREMVKDYFDRIISLETLKKENRPLQSEFRLILDGNIHSYIAVTLLLNERNILCCIRDTSQVKYNTSITRSADHVYIRTFGHFDVFIDGKVMRFSSAKEKELFALLVDRNGGSLTSNEAVAYLYEDEPLSDRLMAKYRKLAMNLKNTLEKNNISDIINNQHGVRNIIPDKVKCDYFELLKGNDVYLKQFNDSYMSDYSWGDNTLNSLLILTEKD